MWYKFYRVIEWLQSIRENHVLEIDVERPRVQKRHFFAFFFFILITQNLGAAIQREGGNMIFHKLAQRFYNKFDDFFILK